MALWKSVFRIHDVLRRIRILGSVQWITDTDPDLDPAPDTDLRSDFGSLLFSSVVLKMVLMYTWTPNMRHTRTRISCFCQLMMWTGTGKCSPAFSLFLLRILWNQIRFELGGTYWDMTVARELLIVASNCVFHFYPSFSMIILHKLRPHCAIVN